MEANKTLPDQMVQPKLSAIVRMQAATMLRPLDEEVEKKHKCTNFYKVNQGGEWRHPFQKRGAEARADGASCAVCLGS